MVRVRVGVRGLLYVRHEHRIQLAPPLPLLPLLALLALRALRALLSRRHQLDLEKVVPQVRVARQLLVRLRLRLRGCPSAPG